MVLVAVVVAVAVAVALVVAKTWLSTLIPNKIVKALQKPGDC